GQTGDIHLVSQLAERDVSKFLSVGTSGAIVHSNLVLDSYVLHLPSGQVATSSSELEALVISNLGRQSVEGVVGLNTFIALIFTGSLIHDIDLNGLVIVILIDIDSADISGLLIVAGQLAGRGGLAVTVVVQE